MPYEILKPVVYHDKKSSEYLQVIQPGEIREFPHLTKGGLELLISKRKVLREVENVKH